MTYMGKQDMEPPVELTDFNSTLPIQAKYKNAAIAVVDKHLLTFVENGEYKPNDDAQMALVHAFAKVDNLFIWEALEDKIDAVSGKVLEFVSIGVKNLDMNQIMTVGELWFLFSSQMCEHALNMAEQLYLEDYVMHEYKRHIEEMYTPDRHEDF